MPTYDYLCPQCGPFETIRAMAQRNDPCACPDCGEDAQRALLSAPRLSAVSGAVRQAHETNERAANAPTASKDYAARSRHPAGCGCCSSGKRGATVTSASGAKVFPSKRPWMISH